MPPPVVSIVTPSYNHGRFIRATIESVLSQDYESLEYIIMDGGSTDETSSVVKDYASRLTFISERDRGQSHAINKGFTMARGSIVAWLNSDDLFLPGAVRKGSAELTAHAYLGAVYGDGYLLDEAGCITGRFPTEPFNLWKLVHLSDYILQQTVFFRKNALEEVGYLDEDLHYAMDWDILIRLGKRYELGYIPECMGCLREYRGAKSFAGGAARAAEIRRVLRRHTGRYLAPGAVTYGVTAYREIWCQGIRSHTPPIPGWLSSKLQRMIAIASNLVIDWITSKAQPPSTRSSGPNRIERIPQEPATSATVKQHP